jgi:hypothetical protein
MSVVVVKSASHDHELEDLLKEGGHMQLVPMRKKNAKRALPPSVSFVQHYYHKAGSLIEQRRPQSMHAVTPQGFELTVVLFVAAYSLRCYHGF